MRGDDGDTVPVDLIEVDSPDALRPEGGSGVHGDLDAPSEDPAAAGPDRRRRRRVLLAVGAGVVLALAATGGVLTALDARRAEARWDALAGRGWPLVDLGAPVEEGWRLADGGWPMAVTTDVVVLQAWLPAASRAAWRAVEVDSGEVLWERPDLGDGWCSQWNPEWSQILADGGVAVGLLGWSGAGGVPDPTMLLCSSGPGFGGELPAEGATSTIEVLDLRSGRLVGSVEAPGDLMSFDPVGDSLVVTTVVADGAIQVTRHDLLGDSAAWSVRTDAVAVEDEGGYVGVWPLVREGALHLVSPDGTVIEARDLDTGARTTAVDDVPVAGMGWMALPDGGRVETGFAQVELDDADTYVVGDPIVTVVAPDGTERFTVHGELFTPWFSDGSMPDRIVVTTTGEGGTRSLVALDVVTGAELWTVPAPWSSSLLQVDGIVVSGSSSLAATDLRTGEQIWERRAQTQGPVTPLTDGSRIAVPTTEDGESFLVAFDIRSGAEQWRVPAIDGVQVLAVVSGGVLLGNESELLYLKVSAED